MGSEMCIRDRVILHKRASVSFLQTILRIGSSRANRLIYQMEKRGVVGPYKGSKERDLLVDESYLEKD